MGQWLPSNRFDLAEGEVKRENGLSVGLTVVTPKQNGQFQFRSRARGSRDQPNTFRAQAISQSTRSRRRL